jgi:hypothetical protein
MFRKLFAALANLAANAEELAASVKEANVNFRASVSPGATGGSRAGAFRRAGVGERAGEPDPLVELADGEQAGVAGGLALRGLDRQRRADKFQDLRPGGWYTRRLFPGLRVGPDGSAGRTRGGGQPFRTPPRAAAVDRPPGRADRAGERSADFFPFFFDFARRFCRRNTAKSSYTFPVIVSRCIMGRR